VIGDVTLIVCLTIILGNKVIAVLRALATQVATKELSSTLTATDLADHVDRTGGIEYWCDDARDRTVWIK
jgi:hypothetical protein